MLREIDIAKVTKIEYAKFMSWVDMFLYEIYYINLWKPAFNKDDKATDSLTITLPELEWQVFETHLWEKWKAELKLADQEDARQKSKCKNI